MDEENSRSKYSKLYAQMVKGIMPKHYRWCTYLPKRGFFSINRYNFNTNDWNEAWDNVDNGDDWYYDYWYIFVNYIFPELSDFSIYDLIYDLQDELINKLKPFNKPDITINADNIDNFNNSLLNIIFEYFAEIFKVMFPEYRYYSGLDIFHSVYLIHYNNLTNYCIKDGEFQFLLKILTNEILTMDLKFCSLKYVEFSKYNIIDFSKQLSDLYSDGINDINCILDNYEINTENKKICLKR